MQGLQRIHAVRSPIGCGSHNLIYEKNRVVLHAATRAWLSKGTILAKPGGMFVADHEGVVKAR